MKKLLLIKAWLLFSFVLNFSEEIPDFNTTLIIIEEQENDKFLFDNTTITDGIFETLWDMNKFIFFDLKLDKPINVISNELDIKPYISIARESGADSILLLKMNYTLEEKGDNLIINFNEFLFNLYSLNDLASIKSGKKSLKINKKFNKKNKNFNLKKIGSSIIKEIY